jgi:competence protein ComGF
MLIAIIIISSIAILSAISYFIAIVVMNRQDDKEIRLWIKKLKLELKERKKQKNRI